MGYVFVDSLSARTSYQTLIAVLVNHEGSPSYKVTDLSRDAGGGFRTYNEFADEILRMYSTFGIFLHYASGSQNDIVDVADGRLRFPDAWSDPGAAFNGSVGIC